MVGFEDGAIVAVARKIVGVLSLKLELTSGTRVRKFTSRRELLLEGGFMQVGFQR